MTRRERLDNGLRVVLDASPHAPVVVIQAWVEVGSADEVGVEAGLAHLHEHMLFKGTASRGVGEIAQEVEAAGGTIGAFTSFDHTVFYLSLPSRSVETGIAIISDVLRESSFDKDELEREKAVVLEELLQTRGNPMRMVSQALFETAYESHPYRLPVIGTEESILGVDRPLMQGFFRKWYGADRIVLAVGGDIDADVVLQQLRDAFGDMRPASGGRLRLEESAQETFRFRVIETPFQQTLIAVGLPIPAHTHEDMPLLDLLGIVLGQGEASRLALRLKRQPGVFHGGSASCFKGVDPGLFTVVTACRAERGKEALDLLMSELASLRYGQVGAEELERAKSFVLSGRVYERDAIEGIVGKHAFFESMYQDVGAEADYYAAVEGATAEALAKVSERYFLSGRVNAVVALEAGGSLDPGLEELISIEERAEEIDSANPLSISSPTKVCTAFSDVVGAAGKEGATCWELPGGGTAILQADATVPMCAIQVIFRGGLRAESVSHSGVTQLLMDCAFQGTEKRNGEEIAQIIESTAGHLSGFVRMNSFGVSGVCLTESLPISLEVLFDVLRTASYPSDEVERERNLQLEAVRHLRDDPTGLAYQLFRETLYGEHPYGMNLFGTEASIEGLDGDVLRRWHVEHVLRSQMTLSFCGDVDPGWLGDALEAACDGWEDPAVSWREPEKPVIATSSKYAECEGPGDQTHMALGFPGTTVDATDKYSLVVLAGMLGGQGGRLFREMREKRSLGYVVHFEGIEGVDPGYLLGYVATHPEKEALALEILRGELARAREEAPSARELERVKNYLIGSYEMGLQSRLTRAAEAGFSEAYGLGWDHFVSFSEGVQAVSREQVLQAAQGYLDPKREVLAIVRPGKN